MQINQDKCINCKKCVPYCPMECINPGEKSVQIDLEECVECGICLRNSNCPVNAIEQTFLTMPRAVRKAFSDPFGKHENIEVKHMGRGTEEIKTNDVTGIIHTLDEAAVAIELGRPGVGARFRDMEKITKAVAKFDIVYEKNNPVTPYIIDKKTGEIEPEILNEKIMSGIVEFRAKINDLAEILKAVKSVEDKVETVFTVAVICKVDENNKPSAEDVIVNNGFNIRAASSKTNMGLGRPLYEDRIKGAK